MGSNLIVYTFHLCCEIEFQFDDDCWTKWKGMSIYAVDILAGLFLLYQVRFLKS